MPIISVIVPVYKVEPYLGRCVDSILCQSFRDFELILVDDGSPDNCGRLCEEYAQKDSRVHVIHQENGGLSAARNTGIDWAFANSNSQWLSFVDSDDWIHSRMLEILLTAAVEHGVKISACGYGETCGETPAVEEGQHSLQLWTPEDFYVSQNTMAITAWGKLYHKSCFSQIRYPVGKLHEDEFTTYRILFDQEQLAVIQLPLYFYFQNAAGITKSLWKPQRLDAVQALGEQAAFFRKHGFQRAYEQAAIFYANKIIQQRHLLQESAISQEEKERYQQDLSQRLKEAGWKYILTYLRKEPSLYIEIFPGLYRIYKRLRGKQ